MIRVNVAEIKAKLSEYLDRAANGERIIVCRHNKPVAELRPIEARRTEPRPIGPLPGRPRFEVPASFFEPMSEEELDEWEGISATDPLLALTQPASRRVGPKVAETRDTPTGKRRRS